jgi:hypothetical protein
VDVHIDGEQHADLTADAKANAFGVLLADHGALRICGLSATGVVIVGIHAIIVAFYTTRHSSASKAMVLVGLWCCKH